jgi:hypothetical protein
MSVIWEYIDTRSCSDISPSKLSRKEWGVEEL